jgi:hypothetical protein
MNTENNVTLFLLIKTSKNTVYIHIKFGMLHDTRSGRVQPTSVPVKNIRKALRD